MARCVVTMVHRRKERKGTMSHTLGFEHGKQRNEVRK